MTSVRYLRAEEAAAYLGISKRTFYDRVRADVTSVHIGTRVVFDSSDLDTWVAAHKKLPPDPVEEAPAPVAHPPTSGRQWERDANGRLRKVKK